MRSSSGEPFAYPKPQVIYGPTVLHPSDLPAGTWQTFMFSQPFFLKRNTSNLVIELSNNQKTGAPGGHCGAFGYRHVFEPRSLLWWGKAVSGDDYPFEFSIPSAFPYTNVTVSSGLFWKNSD